MPDQPANKKTASCACGECTFDLAAKAPGETFSCPKCAKKYRLKEDGRLVQIVVKKVKKTVKRIVKRPSGKVPKPVAAGADLSGDTLLDDAEVLPSASQIKKSVDDVRAGSAAEEAKTVAADLEDDDDLEEIGSDDSAAVAASVSAPTAAMDAPAFDIDGEEPLHTSDDEMEPAKDEALAGAQRPKAAKRSSRREEPALRAERATASNRTRFGEAPMDEGELQPPPPITLDKLVVYMFVGAVPAGAILFAVHIWLGIREGTYKFNVYNIWGIEINGNNPLVWVGGILLGVLAFLGLWVAHTYFFVYLRDKKEKAEREEKEERSAKAAASASAKRPRASNRASKRAV